MDVTPDRAPVAAALAANRKALAAALVVVGAVVAVAGVYAVAAKTGLKDVVQPAKAEKLLHVSHDVRRVPRMQAATGEQALGIFFGVLGDELVYS